MRQRSAKSKRSSALIITLIVLLLVTLLIVSLTSMIGVERDSTHESFESQRARELSNLAVDEVVALLRDNIPTNNAWAAAPGMLVAYTSQTAYNTVQLHSGATTGLHSSTGQVDLNAPILGASSAASYPIIPTNSEYTTETPMPIGWIEVLQDGTLVRPGGTSNQSTNNPVVGRYAYWVDTETSKVNVNTAGRGQSSYYFDVTNFLNASVAAPNNIDSQNLTGSPSRPDLSQLDGNITQAQSLGVYHYTFGGFYLPDEISGGTADYLGAPVYTKGNTNDGQASLGPWANVPTNGGTPATSQGMQRFTSIQQLPQVTSDLLLGAAMTPITAAQVEQNKFYLTTRSYTPELTPWGFNKMWMQGNNDLPAIGISPAASKYGNRFNAPGVPYYPNNIGLDQSNAPGQNDGYWGLNSKVGDSRYFSTPYVGGTSTVHDFQVMGEYENFGAGAFINNMMVQLNRTDWPGFPGESFVSKYGQRECEDLAFNMLCLFDNSIIGASFSPTFIGFGTGGSPTLTVNYGGTHNTNYAIDGWAHYGSDSLYTVDGTTRLFSGIAEWPYLSQISVGFQPSENGVDFLNGTVPYGNANAGQLMISNSINHSNIVYYTKNTNFPGFAPSFATAPYSNAYYYTNGVPINVDIKPQFVLEYPRGFKNPYPIGGNNGAIGALALLDIEVYAKGIWNGTNVTYGGTATNQAPVVDASYGNASNPNHPYFWGCWDQWQGGSFTGAGANTSGIGYQVTSSASSTSGPMVTSYGGTNRYTLITFPDIYVGPFDKGSTVSDVQFRCRYCSFNANGHTLRGPMELAPLGANAVGNEDQAYTNVMTTNSTANPNYAPTFLFEATNLSMSSAAPAVETYSTVDPRVYRYLTDWSNNYSATLPTTFPTISGVATAASTLASFKDPVTGVTGDDSKFAWPDLGFDYFNGNRQFYASSSVGSDAREFQTANNITGFPGVGWLSVLPLNCESSQGATQTGGGGGSGASGTSPASGNTYPIPWRTLSLGPTQQPNQLPDWLLTEAFSVAYDQTYCSQTQGKININQNLNPFTSTIGARTKPLAALIQPTSYSAGSVDNPLVSGATVASALTNGPSGTSYTAPAGASGLPANIFLYPGQICQVAGVNSNGTNQWQNESLARNLIGTITTQSDDFKVHVVAQAVKQVTYSGDPIADFKVTGEQRMSAVVSRFPNLGPDNIPDSATLGTGLSDEPTNMTTATSASQTIAPSSTGLTNILTVTTPVYRYFISDINYINN